MGLLRIMGKMFMVLMIPRKVCETHFFLWTESENSMKVYREIFIPSIEVEYFVLSVTRVKAPSWPERFKDPFLKVALCPYIISMYNHKMTHAHLAASVTLYGDMYL